MLKAINFHNTDVSANKKIFAEFMQLSGEIYRLVKTRSTQKVQIDQKNYFIKKYYPLKIKEILKNLLSFKWPFHNALNEYNAIQALYFLEIKSLEVLAYGVQKKILRQSTSFIITKAIEPSTSLDEVAQKCCHDKFYYKIKRIFISCIAATTRKLHLNGLNHQDYYLCHYLLQTDHDDLDEMLSNLQDIKCHEDKLSNNTYLIDLHRMRMRAQVPNSAIMKDLSALLFSVRNFNITKRDYLRFIKIYFQIENKNKFRQLLQEQSAFFDAIKSRALAIREKG